MIIPLMLFIGLTAMFRGTDGKSAMIEELGKGINLRETNLLGDFVEGEASVFEPLPEKCFIKEKVHYTGSNFDYYASTEAFYSKLAAEFCTRLLSVTPKVSGITLNVRTLTEKILVDKDCLDDEEISTLTSHFVEDFEGLPVTIDKPWLANSWKKYNLFLESHGSHVITSKVSGASIRQTTFAESSSSYSQRDFQVKSCVSLAGPTSVGEIGVEACANVSKSEISEAADMNTADELILRGGSKETRNALRTKRTDELIETFLNEAGESDSGVEHTFRSLWTILLNRFKTGDNYIRAVNLQYYYLGFLNYGCSHAESGDVHMQKFDYVSGYKRESPQFECTLAAEGCHSSTDCHYKPIWCSCRGESCIRYKSEERDTGINKTIAYANTKQDWGWHGCDWKIAGSKCSCQNTII